MFLYVSSLTRPNFQIEMGAVASFVAFCDFEIAAYVIKEPLALENFFVVNSNYSFRISFMVANFISWIIYNPLSLYFVHKHRMHLRDERSNIEQNENLGWILSVTIFM